MSDYWKSTPKYWCDHCKVYVRDTKLEKTNHESTAKHQNNLSKFLRNIHKDNEREERDKQRAKDEVARLTGAGPSSSSNPVVKSTAAGQSAAPPRQATAEERKRQIQQLAAMGVAVPEQYRKDMAMAGDWEVVNSKVMPKVELGNKREVLDTKYEGPVSGIKRPAPEAGLEEEETRKKKSTWGSTTKTYRDMRKDDDLDVLLRSTDSLKQVKKEPLDNHSEQTRTRAGFITDPADTDNVTVDADTKVKSENDASELTLSTAQQTGSEPVDPELDVVFKKRKSKAKR